MKNFKLCADDYALNEPVTAGIIKLIKEQRLSATSCMTTSMLWPAHSQLLLPYQDQIDIGLHWNMTEGVGLSKRFQSGFKPLNTLIIQTHLHHVDHNAVHEELNAQLDQFETQLGRAPDFIDGHQHIHHLPILRQALLETLKQRYPKQPPYIRVSANSLKEILRSRQFVIKKLIIALTGAWRLKHLLTENELKHNDSFAGIYDFKKSYREQFPKFLTELKENGILMCHPGLASEDQNDEIRHARVEELNYLLALASDQLPKR